MQALAQMRSPLAFEPMVAALKDASPDVRHQAAFSLGQLDDPRAVGPLSAALHDTDARRAAAGGVRARQLAREGSRAGDAGALKDESKAEVREQAAFALGQIGEPAAVQAAHRGAQGCRRRRARAGGLRAGQIGDRAAVPALVQALSDAKPDVRQQAAFALSQVGDASAVDALTTAMTKDTDPDVRQQAAFALGQVFGRGGHPREREGTREQ